MGCDPESRGVEQKLAWVRCVAGCVVYKSFIFIRLLANKKACRLVGRQASLTY
jgi:hypothetical protein